MLSYFLRGSGIGCEKKLNNSFSGVRSPADPQRLFRIDYNLSYVIMLMLSFFSMINNLCEKVIKIPTRDFYFGKKTKIIFQANFKIPVENPLSHF